MKINKIKTYKNIAILGYGKEGKSTLKFLLDIGIPKINITILDKGVIQLNNDIKICSGDSYLDNLTEYDIIFKSPGISPYHEKIKPFRDKLTSQTEVFFSNYNGKTIGITATKGKSTTSTLIYETLKEYGINVKIVGNIGNPVLDEINIIDNKIYDYVIYELSSYMLETCIPECTIAILGNIYTCHLDWHNDSFSIYEKAKLNILKKSSYKIISNEFSDYGQNIDNVSYFGLHSKYSYDQEYFYQGKEKLFNQEEILLLGEHNKKNISAVINTLDIISGNQKNIFDGLIKSLSFVLKTFSGLPHRLQKVGKYNGITFIDDGISTTPESTVEAIKTFGSSIGTLFLGGSDYGFTDSSYKLIRNAIEYYNIKNIILFPDTGLDILGIKNNSIKLNSENNILLGKNTINIFYTDSMDKAIKYTYSNTEVGKIALLSCASPSFSLWTGYLEKCKEFNKYMNLYK